MEFIRIAAIVVFFAIMAFDDIRQSGDALRVARGIAAAVIAIVTILGYANL